MDYVPTPKQTLLLWDVLGRGGCTAQTAVPFKVDKKDREALVRAGLLSTRKLGSLWLIVEDKGWAWANDNLNAPLVAPAVPKRNDEAARQAPAKIPTLQNWLIHFGEFLKRKGSSLADVIPYVEPPEPPTKQPRSRKTRSRAGAPQPEGRPHGTGDIVAAVRKAVADIAGAPQREGVRLGRLRQSLVHLSRAELDAALLDMFRTGEVVLMSLANPREIAAERDAAISHKGQVLQVLWLSR